MLTPAALSLRSMKHLLRIILLSCTLLLVLPPLQAQEGISRKKQEKILAAKEKKEKKDLKKQEKKDRRRHMKIQDKETRKRIKRHTRRADRHGKNPHKEGILRRWFGRRN
jgi:hypothetical protein